VHPHFNCRWLLCWFGLSNPPWARSENKLELEQVKLRPLETRFPKLIILSILKSATSSGFQSLCRKHEIFSNDLKKMLTPDSGFLHTTNRHSVPEYKSYQIHSDDLLKTSNLLRSGKRFQDAYCAHFDSTNVSLAQNGFNRKSRSLGRKHYHIPTEGCEQVGGLSEHKKMTNQATVSDRTW
jgi:hypothetical protein